MTNKVQEAQPKQEKPKTLLERRADAVLDKQVRDSETGKISTRREWVDDKVAQGLAPRIEQEDKIKPMSRMAFFRADNQQQAAHERKIKEAGKKDVYFLGDFEITKTEHDYAKRLVESKGSNQVPQEGLRSPAATQKSEPVSQQEQPVGTTGEGSGGSWAEPAGDVGMDIYSQSSRSIELPQNQWLSDTAIADEVEQRIGGFAHQPPVQIRDHAVGTLPGATASDAIAGAVHQGSIYLFRDQLGSRLDVQRTLFHELLHYGLRRFLTREQYVEQLTHLAQRDAFIMAQAERWSAGGDGQRAAQLWLGDYALARGVDEALASLAEPNAGAYLQTGAGARVVRSLSGWLADVADFLGFERFSASVRGWKNQEAREFVQSVFARIESDAPAANVDWGFTADAAFSKDARYNALSADEKQLLLETFPYGSTKKALSKLVAEGWVKPENRSLAKEFADAAYALRMQRFAEKPRDQLAILPGNQRLQDKLLGMRAKKSRDAFADKEEKNSEELREIGRRLGWTDDQADGVTSYASAADINAEGARATVQSISISAQSKGWEVDYTSRKGGGESVYLLKDGVLVRVSDHDLPEMGEREHNRSMGLTGRWSREIITTGWRHTSLGEYLNELNGDVGVDDDNAAFSRATTEEPAFYSELARQIEKSPMNQGLPAAWGQYLDALAKRGAIKADEVEWTGLREWLAMQEGKITKAQISEFLDANGVQVEEVTLGDDPITQQDLDWSEVREADLGDGFVSGLEATFDTRDGGRDSVGIFQAESGYWWVYHQGREVAEDTTKDAAKEAAFDAIRLAIDAPMKGNGMPVKFGKWTVPGGQNYREVLLTLPERESRSMNDIAMEMYGKRFSDLGDDEANRVATAERKEKKSQNYKSSHWYQPNVLAHIRVDERTDADGKRVMFVQELQSDWGQDKKRGKDVPSAPFVTKTDAWVGLAIKRVIKMAADEGFDRVAFINGDQAADLFDLSKSISSISATKTPQGQYAIRAGDLDGKLVVDDVYDGDKLPDVVGKEIADKIIRDATDAKDASGRTKTARYAGLDLKVGGEGMRTFYDQIVPKVAKDVLKKVGGGGLTETTFFSAFETRGEDFDSIAFDITPAIREKSAGGLPLFRRESDQQSTPGITIKDAQAIAAEFEKLGLNKVNVVETIDQMPTAARNRVLSRVPDGDIRGVYFKDTDEVWVVTKYLKNADDFTFVALHESFHRGLFKTIPGSRDLLLQMWRTNQNLRKATKEQMDRHGIGRVEAIEEALADMAGEGRAVDLKGWSKFIALVKSWLNDLVTKVGGNVEWTDAMVETFVAGIKKEGLRKDGVQVMGASPSMSRSDNQANILRALSDNDELFALPKSDERTVKDIAADIDPRVSVVELTPQPGQLERYRLDMPDGRSTWLMVRSQNPYGQTVYGYDLEDGEMVNKVEGRPGENTQAIPDDVQEVYIDASKMKEGGGGAIAYAIASNFALNTDKIFIGDPAGLSDEALRRRSENMLSSALRHGTTEHLAPHPRQLSGDASLGVPALRWVYGDHVGNIERLIDVNLKSIENHRYGSNHISFDPGAGVFQSGGPGSIPWASAAQAVANNPDARKGAGGRTLARAAILRALSREKGGAGSTGGGRNGLLAFLAKLSGDRPQAVTGLFSRANITKQTQEAAIDFFGAAGTQFGWLDKSIKTQYAKAQASPAFGRVFNKVQEYIQAISTFANQAADMAPDILPKLESWKDLKRGDWSSLLRHGLSQEDSKALAAPVFEGTLDWGRDATGKLTPMGELEDKAAEMSAEDKASEMVRARVLDPKVLRMWQGMALDKFESLINNKYEQEMLKAGVVFTDAELKALYRLTDQQIKHYRQFRAAIDESLDQLAAVEALRLLGKDVTQELKDMTTTKEGRKAIRASMESLLADDPDNADLWNSIADKFNKADELKANGYAPLTRFGKFFVHVTDADGNTIYFGLEETKFAANRLKRDLMADKEMAAEYPGFKIDQGVISQEAYRLMSQVPVGAMEMFAESIGAEKSEVFQKYLKLTKNNRSTMKRLIRRKGTKGFSMDAPRVLASFVTSNARAASGGLHIGDAEQLAKDIKQGDVQDEAVKLVKSITEPEDTSSAIRGIMFVNFIGGSIASAAVNLTQPIMMTMPYLTQWGGIVKAGKRMAAAAPMATGAKKITDADLRKAIKMAEDSGTIEPQEIHHLLSQASSGLSQIKGAGPALQKLAFLWGTPFSLAEQFNRRSSFIAAYMTAKEEGITDPQAFAEKAVVETQGLYNTGNRMNWSRNPVGSVALTFKQFSVHYLEWLARMYKSGPEGKRAAGWAIAMLILAAGADGLPFMSDLDDLIDTIGQAMGIDMNSKRTRREFLNAALGDELGALATRGFSNMGGFPVDVSTRMGMGNLLPATDYFLESNQDTGRSVAEIGGAGGGFLMQYFDSIKKMLSGEPLGAIEKASPVAIQNLVKGARMYRDGEFVDSKDRKVMDTDMVDAGMKTLGFQPSAVARESAMMSEQRRSEQLAKVVESKIADKWARGIADEETELVKEAMKLLSQWNKENPSMPIEINRNQIRQRVRALKASRAERYLKTVAPERRAAATQELGQ